MKVSEIYKNAKKTNLEDLLEQFASKQGDETTIISDIKIGDAELSIPIKKVFLSNCIFEKIKFVGDMSQCSFSNCVFDNCVLNQIYGVSLEFQDCTFIDNAFNACRIPKSEFIACDFQKTDMTDCDLSRSNFSLSNYESIHIVNCLVSYTLLAKFEEENKIQNNDLKKYLLDVYHTFGKLLQVGINNFEMKETSNHITTELNYFIKKESESIEDNRNLEHMEESALEALLIEHEKQVGSPVKIAEIQSIDLSGYDFKGFNFQEHNLSFINFSNSDLRNCCFAGCDLSGCDFTGCDMRGAILYNAHFNQVIFDAAQLDDIILDNKNYDTFVKAGIIQSNYKKDESEYM